MPSAPLALDLDPAAARAFEAVPGALLVLDAQGEIVLANEALLVMFGFAREELAGQRLTALLPDAPALPDLASDRAGRRRFAARGLRRNGTALSLEVDLAPADLGPGGDPLFVASLCDVGDRVKLTAALSASEERFRRTFDEAPVGMGMVSLEGRILRVNRAFCRMVGYAEQDLVGRPFDVITHPDDRAADLAAMERVRRGGEPINPRDKRLVHRDGTPVPVQISTAAIRDATGRPLHIIGHMQDAREQKRAEEALRRSESMYRALFELAPEGVLVADDAFRLLDVNPAFSSMFGFAREELVDRLVTEFIGEGGDDRLAELRELVREPGVVHVGEWQARRRDGRCVPTEASTTRLPDGRWIAIVRDIEQRKRLERERETALRRLRTVIDRCPVGIGMIYADDPAHPELNPRARELLEWPRDPAIVGTVRRPDGAVVPFDDAPAIRALRGEQVERMELRIDLPSGRAVPILAYAAPLTDASGATEGAVLAFDDISLEKDLARMRAEWTSIVAHDLRQPVAAILLMARVLARDVEADPAARGRVEQIQSAARSLERMIGDLLDLARAEVRRLPLSRSAVDLPSLLSSSMARAALEAPDRPLSLDARGIIPAVDADHDRVAQIADNLLHNAVAHGAPGTPITVIVEPGEGVVAVTVENEGPGIAEADLPKLFERFRRGAQSGPHSLGLGLYIARQLVEAHGGAIGVERAAGPTRFRFTLPVKR